MNEQFLTDSQLKSAIKLDLVVGEQLDLLVMTTTKSHKDLTITLAEDAFLNIKLLTIGKSLVNDTINIELAGVNAKVQIQSFNLVKKGNCLSTINVKHLAKQTESNLVSIAIAKNDAHIHIINNGYIVKAADKSQCVQQAKGLLLSDKALINAEPNLFIDNYDVDAHHAAAVGSLNDEDLFYMMSRGLTESQASELIIMGFIQPLIDQTSDKIIQQKIKRTFINYLK